ncbi:MAG: hypothetical protein ACI9T7_002632 [Oleiphilaceae bacterium]|jgi:hypothetical protein
MTFSLGSDFIIRLLINTIAILLLVRCYYAFSRNRANASSFLLFGMGVFLVTSLLHTADVSMGFAFGLFAVFSMLRYRTESISIKEMTYLFLVIAIALLSSVGTMQHVELAVINLFVCCSALLLETNVVLPLLDEKEIEYEKIENIVPERKQQLHDDLRIRTGLDIRLVDVVSISFLRDTALLRIHFVPFDKRQFVAEKVDARSHQQLDLKSGRARKS